MQQEQRGRILGASLSVEDGQPVYCYCAIQGRVVHGTLLSVGFRQRMKCMQHDNNCHDDDTADVNMSAAHLLYLEDDFQFDRSAKWKAGYAVHQSARILVLSKNDLQQLR